MTAENADTITLPSPRGDRATGLQEAETGFIAPRALRDALQKVLVDLIALHTVGKQAHWNIVGPNFRDLHLNLDELVSVARDGADTVAERMRALHAAPDGRPSVMAGQTSLPEFPDGEILTHDAIREMVRATEAAVRTMREVHDVVDEADPASADVLHEFIVKLEQQAWFMGAELRTPGGR
ncbi:Dps family protein [Leucobacter sp. HNU]|uniref:Dps family protein n=1 Tax=Leucobacter sp. HNU TaxID=3236805 RepID=UPI003A7FE76D